MRAEEIRHTPLTFLPANGSHTWAGLEPGDPQTHLNDFTEIIRPAYADALPPSTTDMANGTNASSLYYSYEYYMDYLDLIPVDEKKLTANKRES